MSHSTWSTQGDYFRRFEWGPSGSDLMASTSSIVVVVDVLRFSTAVEAVVSRGGIVYPYRWKDESARFFADSLGAQLSDSPDAAGASLSPTALLNEATLDAVVLPSPNGSNCSVLAAENGAVVVAACLRNAPAVAEYVAATSLPVTVLACGERWPDGTLRPSLEDLLGAGAVLSNLGGDLSPEAASAVAAWRDAKDSIADAILSCVSGRELIERGCRDDVVYASDYGVSDVVPVLVEGAFRRAPRLPRH
ncbi:MAG TPA: 2-phosphosulfolactate phosphatase [Acidimicrobiales bacterium]